MRTDRGEKIIHLATALLSDEEHWPPPYRPQGHAQDKRRTLAALCLAAALSAAGGAVGSHWTYENSRPANHYERVEIDALVFYTARQKGVSAAELREEIETATGLPSLEKLSAEDYRRLRTYLRDELDLCAETRAAAQTAL